MGDIDWRTAIPGIREDGSVVAVGSTPPRAAGTVLVFPGHGYPWPGPVSELLTELLASDTEFSRRMQACEEVFAEFVDWPLLDAVRGTFGDIGPGEADMARPVLFAVTVSLAEQWRAAGAVPDAVVGHSCGEIAAACVAGALSLREATKVAVLQAYWTYFAHNLDLDQIGALREALLGELSELRPQTADITFISTVTGAALDTSILDGEYWFANLRQPPLLEHAVRWAHEHGYRYFIETSPHPVLTRDIQSILDPRGRR